jgi:sterol desaturase/sphingolipid hydroxylase (fatty acid hydroxylase superfamily)
MVDGLIAVIESLGATFLRLIPISILLGLVFAALTFLGLQSGTPVVAQARARDRYLLLVHHPAAVALSAHRLLIVGAALLFGITTTEGLIAFYEDGHGPLADLPLWLQAVIFLVGADVIMYWSHRTFHGPTMWKYHAVHHSSTDLDWISAARFHPVNVGGTANVLAAARASGVRRVVYTSSIVAVGASRRPRVLDETSPWTLGPLRYVIAGPLFHRWHHTLPDQGGEKNFAPTFPVLDLIFGTFYLPKETLPASYGVAEQAFPNDFGAQMVHPFRD